MPYKAEKEFAFSCFDILMVHNLKAYRTRAVLARKKNPQTLKSISAISQARTTTFSQPLAKASSVKELSINLDHHTKKLSVDNEVLLCMKLERSWLQIPMTLSDCPRSTKQSILQRLDGQKQPVLVK